MCAINDPLGQTHGPAGSNHYSHLKFVSFPIFWKVGTGVRTDKTCKNSDHSGLYLWVGLMDQ